MKSDKLGDRQAYPLVCTAVLHLHFSSFSFLKVYFIQGKNCYKCEVASDWMAEFVRETMWRIPSSLKLRLPELIKGIKNIFPVPVAHSNSWRL